MLRLHRKALLGRLPSCALALCLASCWFLGACSQPTGTLQLRVLHDGDTTPARVELLDGSGQAWVASDALPLTLECLLSPPPDWLRPRIVSRELQNPYTATTQFYSGGASSLELPPGRYQLRVYKGNEFRVAKRVVEVEPEAELSLDVELERWTDPGARGWHSADDHIHISRYRIDQNPWLASWMAAEGLHVANLLQMGTADQFTVTPQYAFGDAGVYRESDTVLLSGQEHPRTHFLGHTITLGAREPIDLRDSYIFYEKFWRESERLGGVSGFAHLGQGPANDGLAISAPGGRVHFVEVLQFEYPGYAVWYELLNLGFRIAPSAGTDFPCIPSTPGRERVYVQVAGELTRQSFVEGVRRGQTFVTNGPVLELRAGSAGMGDEIRLDAPGSIRVTGSVHFDPERDDVRMLELVRGGEVIHSEVSPSAPGQLTLAVDVRLERSSWLGLRASGSKLDEAPYRPPDVPEWALNLTSRFGAGWSFEGRDEYLAGMQLRPSAAHTAAIFVRVAGTPTAAPQTAGKWIARLDELEARLKDARIAQIPIWDWMPYSDGVSEQHLQRQRPALLEAIATARAHYQTLERETVR